MQLYSLKNNNNIQVVISDFGGKIISISVPDKHGVFADVVLGYDTLQEAVQGDPYFGAIIGRCADRIATASMCVDGKLIALNANCGQDMLHGGEQGYHAVVWRARQDGNRLILSHQDPSGHEGFPGTVDVTVTYQLHDDNSLSIDYQAVTDQPTPINLTSHGYFNLAGAGSGSMLDHQLMINAEYITAIDANKLATGELLAVVDTPLDFSTLTVVREGINANHAQLQFGEGYDHCWVLKGEYGAMKHAATVLEPESGRVMTVHTTEPGLQFYSGNDLDGSVQGKGGKCYQRHSGFCLEAQHFADAPNQLNFPSVIVRPGDEYYSKTVYQFSVVGHGNT